MFDAHFFAVTKLRKEFQEILNNPLSSLGCTVGLIEDNNLFRWRTTLFGAEDSLHKGGIFRIELNFPDDYPQKGPRIRFLTPIYHLNISPKGDIYPNFIVNDWNQSITVKEILIKLFTIFYLQNPLNPIGTFEKAKEYIEKRSLFESKAKYFTHKYALITSEEYNDNKDWDFSYDESNFEPSKPEQENKIIINNKHDFGNKYITLAFSFHALFRKNDIIKIECQLNELIRDVIERLSNKTYIKDISELIFIYKLKRLDLYSQVGLYFSEDSGPIIIIKISDIIFV
jgi:ubiquitin-conjugating enzyme E2 D/E